MEKAENGGYARQLSNNARKVIIPTPILSLLVLHENIEIAGSRILD